MSSVKSGYLQKQSLHLKRFRIRWIVLKNRYLYCYKDNKCTHLTETLDLRAFNHVQISSNGEIGQFELISYLRKRIFIAKTFEEMHQWIKFIEETMQSKYKSRILSDKLSIDAPVKYANNINNAIDLNSENKYDDINIGNYNDSIFTDCNTESVDKCISLRRISSILKFYQDHSNNYNVLSKYLLQYKHVINDYHHILDHHLNEDNIKQIKSNEQFTLIYHEITNRSDIICDVNKCAMYSRNNRIREKENIECNDKILSNYINILDTIHCYFVHSADIGYRIINKIQIDDQNDANIAYD
eukprot:532213_1